MAESQILAGLEALSNGLVALETEKEEFLAQNNSKSLYRLNQKLETERKSYEMLKSQVNEHLAQHQSPTLHHLEQKLETDQKRHQETKEALADLVEAIGADNYGNALKRAKALTKAPTDRNADLLELIPELKAIPKHWVVGHRRVPGWKVPLVLKQAKASIRELLEMAPSDSHERLIEEVVRLWKKPTYGTTQFITAMYELNIKEYENRVPDDLDYSSDRFKSATIREIIGDLAAEEFAGLCDQSPTHTLTNPSTWEEKSTGEITGMWEVIKKFFRVTDPLIEEILDDLYSLRPEEFHNALRDGNMESGHDYLLAEIQKSSAIVGQESRYVEWELVSIRESNSPLVKEAHAI